MRFKVGDRVKRLDDGQYGAWKHGGQTLTVRIVLHAELFFKEVGGAWYTGYFRLAERQPINLQDWVV